MKTAANSQFTLQHLVACKMAGLLILNWIMTPPLLIIERNCTGKSKEPSHSARTNACLKFRHYTLNAQNYISRLHICLLTGPVTMLRSRAHAFHPRTKTVDDLCFDCLLTNLTNPQTQLWQTKTILEKLTSVLVSNHGDLKRLFGEEKKSWVNQFVTSLLGEWMYWLAVWWCGIKADNKWRSAFLHQIVKWSPL